jgi:hypothetical protein
MLANSHYPWDNVVSVLLLETIKFHLRPRNILRWVLQILEASVFVPCYTFFTFASEYSKPSTYWAK